MTDYLAGDQKNPDGDRDREIAASNLLELLPIRGAVERAARPSRNARRRIQITAQAVTRNRWAAAIRHFHSQATADWVAAFPSDSA
jgi:hypothetical protein